MWIVNIKVQGIPGTKNTIQDHAFLMDGYGMYLDFDNKDNVADTDFKYDSSDDDDLTQDDILAEHLDVLKKMYRVTEPCDDMSALDGEPEDIDNPYIAHSRNC